MGNKDLIGLLPTTAAYQVNWLNGTNRRGRNTYANTDTSGCGTYTTATGTGTITPGNYRHGQPLR